MASYSYDAWGNIISQTGTMASSNPYRYASYRYDEKIGLYYLLARHYNPNTGVFLSFDPDLGDEDYPIIQNGYTYANNNPVMNVDPDGQKATGSKSKGPRGKPNSVEEIRDKHGNVVRKRYYGPDGRAVKDVDLTNHGNPAKHPKVPHSHDWKWEGDKPTRGPAYAKKVRKGLAVAGGGYIIYRGIRLLPSLLPPLWWTIPENLAIP